MQNAKKNGGIGLHRHRNIYTIYELMKKLENTIRDTNLYLKKYGIHIIVEVS